MYKTILIATDGSPLSEKAVTAGVALAGVLRAKIVAIHVFRLHFNFPLDDMETFDSETLAQLRESAQRAGRKILDQVEKQARSAGVECAAEPVEGEWPWQRIIQTAKDKNCDLIVMASHGYHGFRGLVLGSETNKVLTHSTIPVLVYR